MYKRLGTEWGRVGFSVGNCIRGKKQVAGVCLSVTCLYPYDDVCIVSEELVNRRK